MNDFLRLQLGACTAPQPLRLVVAFTFLAVLAIGCGDGDTTVEGEETSTGGTDVTAGDVGEGSDVAGDTVGVDTVESDTAVDGAEVSLSCPGGPGCECKADDGCYSGHCIQAGKATKVCAQKCDDGACPEGETCVEIAGTGSAVDKVCVPKFATHCAPCTTNDSCGAAGALNAACIKRGNDGSFCGNSCNSTVDCPQGALCETATDITGKSAKYCVMPPNEVCACSPGAIAAGATTTCHVPHSNGGTCAGSRTCLPAGAPGAPDGGGLTACDAPKASTETCDGVDNDCNGKTDDGTCDDGNPCTTDACSGDKGCTHNANTGAPCDADGSICTENDSCDAGKCKAGAAKACNDANPCTNDSCDAKLGCQTAPASGDPCNADDNPCTVADQCKDGTCLAGSAKACDSGDTCMLGKCNLADGKCTYNNKNGQPCNDGNPCTSNELCAQETCKGGAVNCDDGSPCTADSCDPATGCLHKAAAGPCNDADSCTQKDNCEAGKCVGIAIDVTASCNDNDACTTDSCEAKAGCVHTPKIAGPCDDGNVCTLNDACQNGKCISGPNNCGCEADKDCATKEDGNLCNGTLFCDISAKPFQCKVKPTTVVACDTSLNGECQQNACNASTGKCAITQATDGKPCDSDSSVCTKDDQCKAGTCQTGALVGCDDKNPCTDDACDAKNGCSFKPNTTPCDADGDSCTVLDVCASGTCVPGKGKDCDDKEFCTDDLCEKATGKCANKPRVDKCDDANLCTTDDACGVEPTTKLYTCVGGKNLDCNDKNPCTTDQCDAVKGCIFSSVGDGANCEDGNACTAGDSCAKGKCAGQPIDVKVKCDDGNPCTTDVCDAEKGCVHNADDVAICDDGNACTKNDFCKDGKCAAGVNTCGCNADIDCASKEDGNLCNGTLYCDKSAQPFQCKVNPGTVVNCDTSLNSTCQQNACNPTSGKCGISKEKDGTPCKADDNVCTTTDACTDGICKPGPLLTCDDKSTCTSDACDPKAGCVATPLSGPCNDDDACTELDACQGGICKGAPFNDKVKCDDGNDCTLDVCDSKSGCLNKVLDGKTCDDGNSCTQNDACVQGKCKGGANTCGCEKDLDCAGKEDGNACNGTLFCDKDKQCKINPVTVIACDTSSDNFCKKTDCDVKLGKCVATLKTDGASCDADESLCTTQDACAAGACKPGKLLVCDDKNACTADSCDPKLGCVHTAQGGDCNADDDACTAGDACQSGKCVAGKQTTCDDKNPCTSDSCDTTTGKCGFKELIQSCSDDNACTSGDNCGKNASGAWVCIAGKTLTCEDGNVCTEDSCSTSKGCANVVNTNLSDACYSHDAKTRGKGECKDGVKLCQADGSLGVCKGDKGPTEELCDGKDNDCDGITDEGCAPTAFVARHGNGSLSSKGDKFGMQAQIGMSNVAGKAPAPQDAKNSADFGFFGWVLSLLGK